MYYIHESILSFLTTLKELNVSKNGIESCRECVKHNGGEKSTFFDISDHLNGKTFFSISNSG